MPSALTTQIPEFAALSVADQAVVRRLSGLLRVADGLDRGHSASVKQVDAELAPEALRLRLTAADPGAKVVADLASKSMQIETKVPDAALLETLAGIGYPATVSG